MSSGWSTELRLVHVNPTEAHRRLVLEQRHVGEEVAAGELQFDDGAVAIAARVVARSDRTELPPVSHLDKREAIEQLAKERDAGDPGPVVLGRRHGDRGDPTERPGNDGVLDLE